MKPNAATCFARRGRKITKGSTSSMKSAPAVDAFWNHNGNWCAYQASTVGKGCVS